MRLKQDLKKNEKNYVLKFLRFGVMMQQNSFWNPILKQTLDHITNKKFNIICTYRDKMGLIKR